MRRQTSARLSSPGVNENISAAPYPACGGKRLRALVPLAWDENIRAAPAPSTRFHSDLLLDANIRAFRLATTSTGQGAAVQARKQRLWQFVHVERKAFTGRINR